MSLQRRLPRHVLWDTLAYVNLDRSNGGIILNLNEHGMAVQAAAPVRAQAPVHVNFQLPGTRTFVDAAGEVCWTSASQAGIQFVELAEPERRRLKEALFDSLLTRCAAAHGVSTEPEPRVAGQADAASLATQPAEAARAAPPACDAESAAQPVAHLITQRSALTRGRESVLLLAGTSLFAALFLLTVEIPRESGLMLAAGMAIPCVLLAVLHQIVELQERR
ncbi:MAG TPA: PilZ domain-containing protein [Terriglobales bacterium]|nr:PilZ domain-containing protein [Terriglobales bacterium]